MMNNSHDVIASLALASILNLWHRCAENNVHIMVYDFINIVIIVLLGSIEMYFHDSVLNYMT